MVRERVSVRTRSSVVATDAETAVEPDTCVNSSDMRQWIRDAFNSAQMSTSQHRKFAIRMRSLIAKGTDLKILFEEWQRAVALTAPVKKTETCTHFLVQFLGLFYSVICDALTTDIDGDKRKNRPVEAGQTGDAGELLDQVSKERLFSFLENSIQFLLSGLQAKDKTVRLCLCQILTSNTRYLNIVSPELRRSIVESILKRASDKETSVRLKAIGLLSTLQNEESTYAAKATDAMLYLLQHDPNNDVRKTILTCLKFNTKTMPYFLERSRDIDSAIRRAVYTRNLKQLGDFKYLKLSQREKILAWGLDDRDERVQKAAQQMFSFDWMKNVDDNIIELLERLDAINNTALPKAIHSFFNLRAGARDAISFSDIFWKNLTPEAALLARCFNEFCRTDGEPKYRVEEKMPEMITLCEYIDTELNFIAKLRNSGSESSDEYTDHVFITKQLLVICKTYDFADEIGRKRLFDTINLTLSSCDTDERLLEDAVAILNLLATTESEVVGTIMEIISRLHELNESHEDKKDLDDDTENHSDSSFESARSESLSPSLHSQKKRHGTKLMSPVSNSSDAMADDMQDSETPILIRESSIIQYLLQQLKEGVKKNPKLSKLVEGLIVPSVRNYNSIIREKGILNLGLCCLLDFQLAIENIKIFAHCVYKGHETLKIIALKVISDILSCYKSDIFQENSLTESELINLIFFALKEENSPDLQVTAVLMCCKQYLALVLHEKSILEYLIVIYFDPSSRENQQLRQALAYFFPAYSYSNAKNQVIISESILRSFHEICKLAQDDDDYLEENSLNNILLQLIDWCDPRQLVENVETSTKFVNESLCCDLALPFIRSFLATKIREEKSSLCIVMPKLYVTQAKQESLLAVKEALESSREKFSGMETQARNAVSRFHQTLQKVIESNELTGPTQDVPENDSL